MNFYIAVHLTASLLAIPLGAWILFRKKGDKLHKASGKTFSGLILISCISSLAIRDSQGNFTYIHILTAWTMICMVVSLLAIKNKNIRIHRGFMIGSFVGLVSAGILAIAMPGRILYSFFVSFIV